MPWRWGLIRLYLGAGKADRIKVFGFDGSPDALRSIAENRLSATVMQYPVMMAEMSAVLADEYINGRREFDSRTPVEVLLVTPENVNDFLDAE
jgi:ABC-type sugar transport system substrate-binding protein